MAEICGRHIKKACFELGGSDAYIVLDDCDMELATDKAIQARFTANA